MSRCFPYPPPNYQREEKSLTQSIKLQKELETTKDKKKEKRREKKERKEKSDKSKDKHKSSKHREHGHKKRKHDERNKLETKDNYKKTTATDSIEHLEKSGLTEEHVLPWHPSQEPCESSESTQNSSKKRKLEATNVKCDSHGNTILHLKFSLQKHKDLKQTPVKNEPCFPSQATSKGAEATFANGEPCFSGWATEARVDQKMFGTAHSPSTSRTMSTKTIEKLNFGDGQAESCARIKSNKTFEPRKERDLAEHPHSHLSSKSKSSKRAEKLERKFRDHIVNWKPVPFLLDAEAGPEGQGWLFENLGQRHANSDAQRYGMSKATEDLSHSLQPRACYLPELEMYQLPYVVPF